MFWSHYLGIFLYNRCVFSKFLRVEMFNVIKMFAYHIWITFIAPIWKICKRQGNRMLAFLVVLAHVRVHISAASDLHAFQANPVLRFVLTVFTWICDFYFREFFNWSDVLIRNAMWTFFQRLNSKKSHNRTYFIFIIFGRIYFLFFVLFNF